MDQRQVQSLLPQGGVGDFVFLLMPCALSTGIIIIIVIVTADRNSSVSGTPIGAAPDLSPDPGAVFAVGAAPPRLRGGSTASAGTATRGRCGWNEMDIVTLCGVLGFLQLYFFVLCECRATRPTVGPVPKPGGGACVCGATESLEWIKGKCRRCYTKDPPTCEAIGSGYFI